MYIVFEVIYCTVYKSGHDKRIFCIPKKFFFPFSRKVKTCWGRNYCLNFWGLTWNGEVETLVYQLCEVETISLVWLRSNWINLPLLRIHLYSSMVKFQAIVSHTREVCCEDSFLICPSINQSLSTLVNMEDKYKLLIFLLSEDISPFC